MSLAGEPLNAALVFLDINGWIVADPDERLYDAMLSIATEPQKSRLPYLPSFL